MRQAEKDEFHKLAMEYMGRELPKAVIFLLTVALVLGVAAYGAYKMIV
jgi:hypothetical protein